MKFIADFHIHSHYSIATSKELVPEYLDAWAQLKGIKLVGTGDFVHPGWFSDLQEKLEPAEEGLFRLKKGFSLSDDAVCVPPSCRDDVRFILTAELSSIYKKNGKVRKVHNLIFAPSFETAGVIQKEIGKRGNIESDGRPILGVDSKDILDIVLNASDGAFLVPAHIWTPWFSVLGSKSGFNTIEECYEDLTEHIFALETGLSSDPEMNWMCSFLDRYTLISNSDAHSPGKLGREANLFDTELSYKAIRQALKNKEDGTFLGTIEFYPQEGKYHYDGHRKCGVRMDPYETLSNGGICPVCGRGVTVGVMNRVAELADQEPDEAAGRLPFYSITSLPTLLSEVYDVGENTKTVRNAYHDLLEKSAPEFSVLLEMPVAEIEKAGGSVVAEGIRRMRDKETVIEEGYDGEFGRIRFFLKGEKETFSSGGGLFESQPGETVGESAAAYSSVKFSIQEYKELLSRKQEEKLREEAEQLDIVSSLNAEQREAVKHVTGPCMIIAGPGTGKTFTLTARIAELIHSKDVSPEHILAVTFTNKAAQEMKDRLKGMLERTDLFSGLNVSTLHAFGLSLCKEYSTEIDRTWPVTVIGEEEKRFLLIHELNVPKKEADAAASAVTHAKQNLLSPEESDIQDLFVRYESLLKDQNVIDIDDCIRLPVLLMEQDTAVQNRVNKKYKWICIDEYQDINHIQYRLIRCLAPDKDSNLCVIGDPDQSIYGFRGADRSCIQNFPGDYPEARVFRLKQSYRCSNRILEASGDVIDSENMLKGLQKGVKITVKQEDTDRSEAEFIARTIEKLIGGMSFFSIDSDVAEGEEDSEISSLSDFAVLFRISRQADLIKQAMLNHNIPHHVVSTDCRLREHPALDFLRLAVNPAHTLALQRLMGNYTLKKGQKGEIVSCAAGLAELSPEKALRTVMQTYSNENDMAELIKSADICGGSIEDFLSFITLGRDIDRADLKAEQVTLMTMHAAKGLEFKCVFIAGCEEGLVPYSLFEDRTSDPDEERRLLYVGMTRAQRFLYLTNSKRRNLFGRSLAPKRSPFVEQIRKDLLKMEKTTRRRTKKKQDDGEQLTFF